MHKMSAINPNNLQLEELSGFWTGNIITESFQTDYFQLKSPFKDAFVVLFRSPWRLPYFWTRLLDLTRKSKWLILLYDHSFISSGKMFQDFFLWPHCSTN